MNINQIDHTYELKIDLGNYQTGTVEFYALAELDRVDIAVARQALQDMAARNLRLAGAKVQGKKLPETALGLDASGMTVTKIGVGYGKKIKLGRGVGNRNIYHRVWAQILPGDDLQKSIGQLWQTVFDAYEEKIAALQPKPKAAPKEAPPPAAATTPETVKGVVLKLAAKYRGKGEVTPRLRFPAIKALEGAVGQVAPDWTIPTVSGWILGYLFGDGTAPLSEFDLEAQHFSGLLRWSKRDTFQAEVKLLVDYLDGLHHLTKPTEKAF